VKEVDPTGPTASKCPRGKGFNLHRHRRVRHESYRGWSGYRKAGFSAALSEEQQAVLALHRMREQLVKFRTVQINGLRGLLRSERKRETDRATLGAAVPPPT
jgi:transposase